MSENYLLKRVVAYFIDMFVVFVFTTTLTDVKFLNPTYDEYNACNAKLEELGTSYTLSYIMFEYYYQDNEISTEEYETLIDNNMFSYLFVDAYSDNIISEEEKNSIVDTVQKYYNDNSDNINYEASKASWYSYLVYIVVYLIYFVGFNIITKGATLGKKLLKLRIESMYDDGSVLWYQYLFRTLLQYNIVIYFICLILPFILNGHIFTITTSMVASIGSLIEFINILCILIRNDRRGLHDILGKTKVVESE